MTKEDLLNLLRIVGVDENTLTLVANVYDIGYDAAKEEAFKQGFILGDKDE